MLRFRVKGAGDEDFTIGIDGAGDYIRVRCTCPSGGGFKTCSHRIALLCGSIDNLIDEHSDDPGLVKPMIAGSELERAVQNVLSAENGLKAAQKALRDAKEYLGVAMTVTDDRADPKE